MMDIKNLVYVLTRITIGVSMLGHGLVRLPKIAQFSEGMAKKFADSMLPDFIVSPFGYALTVAEFAIGILLVLGLFTKKASVAGMVVMISLIFGSCLVENWAVINSQLIHAAFFAFLIWFLHLNSWSIDRLLKK